METRIRTFRVDDERWRRFTERVEMDGETRSEVLRRLIDEYTK